MQPPTSALAHEPAAARGLSSPAWLFARRTLRYWKSGVVVLATAAAVLAWLVSRTHEVYRSEAVILYRQSVGQGYGDAESSRRVGARLRDTLFSRQRLKPVVEEFGLYPKAPNGEAALDLMMKNISFQIREGSTFMVAFGAADRELAQKVASKLAQSLMGESSRQRAEEADATRRFLDAERERLGKEAKEREEAVTKFLREHAGILAPSVPVPAAGANLADIFNLEIELEKLRKEERTEGLPAPTAEAPRPDETAAIEAERQAAAELARARQELSAKRQTLSEAHPDYAAARDAVPRAEERWRAARDALQALSPARPKSASGAPTSDVRRRIHLVEMRLADLRKQPRVLRSATRSPEIEQQLQGLRRLADEARERLQGIEDKAFAAAMVAKLETGEETGRLEILDPAHLPGPAITQARLKVAAAGTMVAFLLMILVMAARAFFDDRLYGEADVAWLTPVSLLAAIPREDRRKAERR